MLRAELAPGLVVAAEAPGCVGLDAFASRIDPCCESMTELIRINRRGSQASYHCAMNEYLPTAPFDIYELHLFELVAQHRSFTKAAEVAGLTQSAVTRQVQGMESSLGVELFERTTRSVSLTAAGAALWRQSGRLLGDIDQTLRSLREDFAGARKVIRVGVSRSVGLAYLPGFFHANLRRHPNVGYRVAYQPSVDIFSSLERNETDVGVLCPPPRMPRTVRVTHRFNDAFVLIASADAAAGFAAEPAGEAARRLQMCADCRVVDLYSRTDETTIFDFHEDERKRP